MEFWHQKWSNQQIGFHRPVVNDLLAQHWASLNCSPASNVLVPLCGKSLDLHWLATKGHSITGVELVKQAVEAFFQEAGTHPEIEAVGTILRYNHDSITILQGDFFSVSPDLAGCDAWYDRAAMVALPSEWRARYVDQIHALTQPGAVGLMITFTYPQDQMQGPPFSLPNEEVMALFDTRFEVELLDQVNLIEEKQRGLSSLTSSVYKIRRV